MSGGMHAWQGLAASGAPESGMAYFPDSATPQELIGLAWKLEDGSGKFYLDAAAQIDDAETSALLNDLATAEKHHKESLVKLAHELFDTDEEDLRNTPVFMDNPDDVMEGGIKVSEALAWAEGKDAREVLEFTMGAEANAYDLYIKMLQKLEDEKARKIFTSLADEEKNHLERMGALLKKKV
jgi:rubrerythrin